MGIFRKKKEPEKPFFDRVIFEREGTEKEKDEAGLDSVSSKIEGDLDMVIAFDTTGSMASYIGAVRKEVSELVPRLFADNKALRLGIVAFGDYCDMKGPDDYGKAYQCLPLTDNENDIIKFIRESEDTSRGDGDEFYELVLKKIIDETSWRKDSTKSILLIADANPHPLGYSFENMVVGNQIDWKQEAGKAAAKKIKIDTVTITDAAWYRELSAMTNGVSVPFHTGYKTRQLIEASVYSRSSASARMKFDWMFDECDDDEMKEVFRSYKKERDTSK